MKNIFRILLICLFLLGIVSVAKLNNHAEQDSHPKRGGGGCVRVPSQEEIEAAMKRGEDPMNLCKTSK